MFVDHLRDNASSIVIIGNVLSLDVGDALKILMFIPLIDSFSTLNPGKK